MQDVEHIKREGRTILVIDDSSENLALMEAIIESSGYNFHGACSGQEGLSLARRVTPRAILLDIQMAGFDGFETCRRIRMASEVARVPVVFLTSCRTPADVRMGMAAGGNDFIIKPVDPERLISRLDHWSVRRNP